MPANKDPDTSGKWLCQFYFTDWTGTRKKKKKRGFDTKRGALEWEREFLKHQRADMSMKLSAFVDLYLEDMGHRLRASTLENKRFIYNLKIKPYLGEKPMNLVTSPDVRKWQNELMAVEHQEGKKYSPTYLKTVNNQLTALFNYAVKILWPAGKPLS